MGRRSINTTKSGKYMNPTDQARKEARKKELKKNKKQRQMVRAAVLKGKDPLQIIDEMEKIDQMEYNVLQPSPLNEKVLKEKRKKLRDTLDRVLKMYNKDDPEKWVELKRSQAEYERRRNQLMAFYESVKHAQQVSVDEIPLPALQVPEHPAPQIPLPNNDLLNPNLPTQFHISPAIHVHKPPPSILKRNTVYGLGLEKEPPGVPPGPPPDLSSCSEDEDEPVDKETEIKATKQLRFSDDVTVNQVPVESKEDEPSVEPVVENTIPVITSSPATKSKPTSLQQRMVAISGQNIDEFMKEMEAVHMSKDAENNASTSNADTVSSDNISPVTNRPEEPVAAMDTSANKNEIVIPPGTEQDKPIKTSNTAIPPPVLFRPPLNPLSRPVMPLMPLRLPPGPPPGRPNIPPGPPPGLPPRLGLRLPPGPPPGIPPRMMRIPVLPPTSAAATAVSAAGAGAINPNVLSAAPQLINRSDVGNKIGATIMAKPQIRNLSADVTRFIPSALRVKREDKKLKPFARHLMLNDMKHQDIVKSISGATKDDAYMQFMREMEGLL